MAHLLASLEPFLLTALPSPERVWLAEALSHEDPACLSADFTLAKRGVGEAVLADQSAPGWSRGPESAWLLAGAPADELARVAILARATESATDPEELVREWYRLGDIREKRSVLRALPLLPHPSRFAEVGIAACRTSVQTVFEGICCENPYAAEHFPDAAFEQMVLKAFFTQVRVARIVGLSHRRSQRLARLAQDYARERRAAGRAVPSDLDSVLISHGGRQ